MRTTVTLDSETERLLRRAVQVRGVSFKVALNDAIQRGLADLNETPARFVVEPVEMGLRPGFDPARLNSLADDLEAEAFAAREAAKAP